LIDIDFINIGDITKRAFLDKRVCKVFDRIDKIDIDIKECGMNAIVIKCFIMMTNGDNFADTREGEFIETILAAQGQLERKQNRRQVIQKMKARFEQGFWIFRAPVGYKYINSKRGGKELVIDEPVATTAQHALEGFASVRLDSQYAVRKFLEDCPYFPKDLPNGELRHETVVRLLCKVVYAGYVEAPSWNMKPQLGNHEALISYEAHLKILQILNKGLYAPKRKDLHHDFRFVVQWPAQNAIPLLQLRGVKAKPRCILIIGVVINHAPAMVR